MTFNININGDVIDWNETIENQQEIYNNTLMHCIEDNVSTNTLTTSTLSDNVIIGSDITIASGQTITLASSKCTYFIADTISIVGDITGVGLGGAGGGAKSISSSNNAAGSDGTSGYLSNGGNGGEAGAGGAGNGSLTNVWQSSETSISTTMINFLKSHLFLNTVYSGLPLLIGGGGGSGGLYTGTSSSAASPAGGNGGASLVLIAKTITISGTISLSGNSPANSSGINNYGAGGSGGGGAGSLVIVATDTLTLTSATFNCVGGDGGDGAGSLGTVYGGDGGSGGYIFYSVPRSDSITGTPTTDLSGGAAGTGEVSGSAGTDGVVYTFTNMDVV